MLYRRSDHAQEELRTFLRLASHLAHTILPITCLQPCPSVPLLDVTAASNGVQLNPNSLAALCASYHAMKS